MFLSVYNMDFGIFVGKNSPKFMKQNGTRYFLILVKKLSDHAT